MPNPIIPNQGINDPHIHVFNDVAYLYASHDTALGSTDFAMADWHVWSSTDLVNWAHRSTLTPAQTYIGEAPGFDSAWATDAAEKDGKYYWYFSEGERQIGVVVGDTPMGPWRDPLGRPLIAERDTATRAYDPGIYAEGDDRYIVFGRWNYHLAKLADNMISLAHAPRPLEVRNAQGPYTFSSGTPHDGETTDDKPFLHRYLGRYYLSWGGFYAMSDTIEGPYDYAGCIIDESSFPDGLDFPTWPEGPKQGRHGSFFEWYGQTYFAFCDISSTGNRYFRDTAIGYVHYRHDGTMAPIRIDRTGVGSYDASTGPIQMEDFFSIVGAEKREDKRSTSGFVVASTSPSARVSFPLIAGLEGCDELNIDVIGEADAAGTLEVRRSGIGAGSVQFRLDSSGHHHVRVAVGELDSAESIDITWSTGRGELALDRMWFTARTPRPRTSRES